MNKKGGIRYGGMPKGWRKPEGTRKQRQVRAYDDEWEIIREFIKVMREIGVEKAHELINRSE